MPCDATSINSHTLLDIISWLTKKKKKEKEGRDDKIYLCCSLCQQLVFLVHLNSIGSAYYLILSKFSILWNPPSVDLGVITKAYVINYSFFYRPSNAVDYMISVPAHGAIVGGWLGAWPMPLDWERPWQVPNISATSEYILNKFVSCTQHFVLVTSPNPSLGWLGYFLYLWIHLTWLLGLMRCNSLKVNLSNILDFILFNLIYRSGQFVSHMERLPVIWLVCFCLQCLSSFTRGIFVQKPSNFLWWNFFF